MFHFQLKAPKNCMMNIEPNGKGLCWFFLTDSYFYIELGTTRLFQNFEKTSSQYSDTPPYLDYYYIRFLEDLFDILPDIAVGIPKDLYSSIDNFDKKRVMQVKYNTLIGDEEEDIVSEDMVYFPLGNLLDYGRLDTSFLRYNSSCYFYHVEDTMIIHYDFEDVDEEGNPVWSAKTGVYELKYKDFLLQIEDVLNRFFISMADQIEALKVSIQNGDTHFSEINDPYPVLEKIEEEHNQRKKYFFNILENIKNCNIEKEIDWEKIRLALKAIS